MLMAVAAAMAGATYACAQHPEEPKIQVKAYKGFYRFVDEYGDTVRMTIINDIYVYPPLKFKNKKQEEFYWRTVRDVKRTLPYAKLICETLLETYEYIETFPSETHQSGYDILKAFLGSFRATFWQGFGRLFGVNLKGKYSPATDAADAIIERVCVQVEQGQL